MAPPTPYPSLDLLEKTAIRNKRFRESLRKMIEILYESYKKGHQSFTKMNANIALNRELPYFDRTLIEIFNELTYGKR